MRVVVPFGTEDIHLEVNDDRLVELVGGAAGPAIEDVAAAVAERIENPLAFPALRQAIVPGDHVAIVLDAGTPRAADVLGPILECLAEAGVQRHDTAIVEPTRPAGARDFLTADDVPPGVQLVQHDPHDRNRLSYLASTKAGTRVYLNREIVDADLVVLVGRIAYDPILNFRGTSSSVFPGLADAAAQQLFRGQISKPINAKTQHAARAESDEVVWLLGVQFAVQLVIGRRDEVVHVLAGHSTDVQREGQQSLDGYWNQTAPRRAELVIAAINDAPDRQGFHELGAALATAAGLVREGGRIVALSAIAAVPGTTLRSARELKEPEKVIEFVRRHPHDDAVSTWQIARACQHARVYLKSRLADELVEDLSMIPVGTPAEVQRLVDQSASCLILNDAQLARVSVEGENEKSTP
jgi:nickel-dependent lactate racemase